MANKYSEWAKLGIEGKKQRQAEIEVLMLKYRPKIIHKYDENGKTISVVEPRWCEGAVNHQWCR